jgi:hypothetical protein
MIFFSWHIEEDSHIGRSHCDRFRIEISPNGNQFVYRIIENNKEYPTPSFNYDNFEDAKRIAISIVSLQNSM